MFHRISHYKQKMSYYYFDNVPIKISISETIISSRTLLFLDNILNMIFQIIFCRKVFITMITEIIWPYKRS